MKVKLLLILILLLAFLIRVTNLSSVPPSLNWDEVSHGYNAYSILKSGSDEWGQIPIANFRAYGDYPLPLDTYLSIPWILIFGLNEFSIRLTSVLFGSLTLLIIFVLAKEITKKEYLALLAAFMVAISPWGILTSRQVLQSTPAVFFLSLGILLFVKGINNKLLLIFSALSFSLSAYGYHNTRILAYPLIIILSFFFRNFFYKAKKIFIYMVLILIVSLIPIVMALLSSEASARSAWVGILDQGVINQINFYRGSSALPNPLPQFLYNKPVFLIEKTVTNYIGYFNPIFLGFNGGTQYQFSVPGFGIVYPTELIFFYLGLLTLTIGFKNLDLTKKFILIWLLLSPIPAAITRDEYQVIRSSVMMPVFYLVTLIGLENCFGFLKRFNKKLIITFIILFITSSLFLWTKFYTNYFYDYPVKYSFAWQYGYKEVTNFIRDNYDYYPSFSITKKYGEPHEFLLFYLQYDPIKYKQDSKLIRYKKSDWFWVDRFDKFNFLNDWEVIQKTKDLKKGILITSPGNYPTTAKKINTINFLDGQPAFDIVELK